MSSRGGKAGQAKRFPYKGPRVESSKQPDSHRTVGAIAELPILRYGKSTNFEEFKRRISVYAQREYVLLESIFRTEQYEDPPDPVQKEMYSEEELSKKNDTYGLLRLQLQEEVKERVKVLSQIALDKKRLFAVMWGQLSPESEQIIMQHAEWAAISAKDDPLQLWKAIKDTHVVTATGQVILDRMSARDQYTRLRQDARETLVSFKERTDEALRALEAYDIPTPSDQDQTSDFINRLDTSRYGPFKTHLRDLVVYHDGAGYPQTLTEAYNKAAIYRPFQLGGRMSEGLVTQSVFATHAHKHDRNRHQRSDQRGNDHNSAARGRPWAHKNKDKHKHKERGTGKEGCLLCGSMDHWVRQCPHRDRARSLIARETSGEVVATTVTRKEDRENKESKEPRLQFSFVLHSSPTCLEVTAATADERTMFGRFEVLLDNQATKSVFREQSLLKNIRKDDVSTEFVGMGGSQSTDLIGEFMDFGIVSYMPTAIANILSFAEVEDRGHQVKYIPHKGFRVKTTSGGEYVFKRKAGLFVCDSTERNLGHTTHNALTISVISPHPGGVDDGCYVRLSKDRYSLPAIPRRTL